MADFGNIVMQNARLRQPNKTQNQATAAGNFCLMP